jgi:hypothetical protein
LQTQIDALDGNITVTAITASSTINTPNRLYLINPSDNSLVMTMDTEANWGVAENKSEIFTLANVSGSYWVKIIMPDSKFFYMKPEETREFRISRLTGTNYHFKAIGPIEYEYTLSSSSSITASGTAFTGLTIHEDNDPTDFFYISSNSRITFGENPRQIDVQSQVNKQWTATSVDRAYFEGRIELREEGTSSNNFDGQQGVWKLQNMNQFHDYIWQPLKNYALNNQYFEILSNVDGSEDGNWSMGSLRLKVKVKYQ